MLTLVDTSVWIDHFRNGNRALGVLLERDEVLVHPFVIGELACGTLANRSEILQLLADLPHAVAATDEEVHELVKSKKLWGKGMG